MVLTHLRHRLTARTRALARPASWRRARKFAVALLGVLAQVAATGLLPAPWDTRSAIVLAFATALGVYRVPNAVPPG